MLNISICILLRLIYLVLMLRNRYRYIFDSYWFDVDIFDLF